MAGTRSSFRRWGDCVALFTVTYDPDHRILHLTMSGFWTVATVDQFAAEIQRVVDAIPGSPRHFDVLSESVDLPVQSEEVSEALARITADFQGHWNGRTALAVKRMLNKLQADRTMAMPRVKAFLTVDAAMMWLRYPEPDAP